MKNSVIRFVKDDDGAVTVDWVVLTALIVGLAMVAFAGIDGGVATLTSNIASFLSNILVQL